ncbi:MAG: phosphoethanolamine--lipid A transferase EptA [Epsilonproteobacteria bacterium]|nr:phosphoethanolamine--lipid A transferase EptA [Campylobacterota bacterium]
MNLGLFTLIAVLSNIILYHLPFFHYVTDHLKLNNPGSFATMLCVSIALFGVNAFLFYLVASISARFFKFFLIITSLGNALAFYFVQTYSVILDRSMMGNVFNTRYSEASAYFDPIIFLYIFLLGIIPAYIVYKTQLRNTPRKKLLLGGFGALIFSVFVLYLNSFTWLWLDKHAKYLGGLSMPWSYSINALRYEIKKQQKSKKQKLLPDGKFLNDTKVVVLLIIGESARADHFSLYGYNKPTNPRLSNIDIIALKPVMATTTYTTGSVASILAYDGSSSNEYEPLPNYLHRMGAYVEWRSKNWGAPNLNIDHFIEAGELKQTCQGDRCDYDEVLLTNLKQSIRKATKNKIFIVLHTAGSHGPTYYQKYPPSFEHFQPVCKTVDLKKCTQEELFNAYDNTIYYTDYFLSKAIEQLKKLNMPSLMIYISDHGESLGEYNLYLHGTPYAIAPRYQKEVPLLLWASKQFLQQRALNTLAIKKEEKYGQYNIFHTVLEALSLQSPIFNQKHNLLANQKDQHEQ